MDNALYTWTVYFNPLDYPGRYVGRRFKGMQPEDDFIISDDVEVVREWIKKQASQYQGLFHKLPRHPLDENHIVEVWL